MTEEKPIVREAPRSAAEKLASGHFMTRQDFTELLAGFQDPRITELLAGEAVRVRNIMGQKYLPAVLLSLPIIAKTTAITAESAALTAVRSATA